MNKSYYYVSAAVVLFFAFIFYNRRNEGVKKTTGSEGPLIVQSPTILKYSAPMGQSANGNPDLGYTNYSNSYVENVQTLGYNTMPIFEGQNNSDSNYSTPGYNTYPFGVSSYADTTTPNPQGPDVTTDPSYIEIPQEPF